MSTCIFEAFRQLLCYAAACATSYSTLLFIGVYDAVFFSFSLHTNIRCARISAIFLILLFLYTIHPSTFDSLRQWVRNYPEGSPRRAYDEAEWAYVIWKCAHVSRPCTGEKKKLMKTLRQRQVNEYFSFSEFLFLRVAGSVSRMMVKKAIPMLMLRSRKLDLSIYRIYVQYIISRRLLNFTPASAITFWTSYIRYRLNLLVHRTITYHTRYTPPFSIDPGRLVSQLIHPAK